MTEPSFNTMFALLDYLDYIIRCEKLFIDKNMAKDNVESIRKSIALLIEKESSLKKYTVDDLLARRRKAKYIKLD